MASPFSRTLRSLHSDTFTLSMALMLAAIILFIFWYIWFFRTEVPVYKISSKARLTKEENVISAFFGNAVRAEKTWERSVEAEFGPKSIPDIRPGQKAVFYPAGNAGKKAGSVPAVVSSVGTNSGKVRLTAYFKENNRRYVKPGLSGKVRVVVENTTPFRLVLRSSGF